MYDGYAFEVIVERDGHYPRDHKYPAVPAEAVLGDCWHRFYVRMLEVMQAIDLTVRRWIATARRRAIGGQPIKLTTRSCPRGGLSGDRVPAGSDGLLSGERRIVDSVACPRTQQLLLQPVGHPRNCAEAA